MSPSASLEGTGRAANEEIIREWGQLVCGDRALFRCECGISGCVEGIWLPVGVYERVREDPMHCVIQPAHVLPEVEEVVEQTSGYAVIRKFESVRHIVEDESEPS